MANTSVVPELQLPGDPDQDIHPLRFKKINVEPSGDGWFEAWEASDDPTVLHALLDAGFPGWTPRQGEEERVTSVMADGGVTTRRFYEYLAIADGHAKADRIFGGRAVQRTSWNPTYTRQVSSFASHAYRVLVERCFAHVKLRSQLAEWTKRQPELIRAILRFARIERIPWESNLSRHDLSEANQAAVERFAVEFSTALWTFREWSAARPQLVQILNHFKQLDVLLDNTVVVDRQSMKAIEKIAMEERFGKTRSVEEAACEGGHAAQILILLRVKHGVHRKREAIRAAEEREQAERHRKEARAAAEKQLEEAKQRLAALGAK